ncbi:MAG: Do family serine endopeptidase [Phycisphaerae bacterium]|nr:Do family serine endopeptidase [Phycisphaerae bacterium]
MSMSVVRSENRLPRTLFLAVFASLLFSLAPVAPAEDEQSIAALRQMGRAFASIAGKTSPAVVGVRATKTGRGASRMDSPSEQYSPFDQDLFEYFFRRQMPRQYERGQPKQVVQGSGFIVSADGYILTNNHLVGETEEVRVQLDDRRTVKARVIGADPETDVAVIKIDATDLPYVELADSDTLEVGQWVIAIGNPFGLSHTVTAGIVSAKGRSRIGVADYEDFIQTDAAINFGNSGGPLLNLDGQAVGINTAIIGSGGNIGIGLAIPINMAKAIYAQLKESGKVVRGYLGVEIGDVGTGVGEFYGAADDRGAMVTKVVEGSPAEKAGVKVDDIVVELEGEPVAGATELMNKVAMRKPGTDVNLTVLRDGKRRKLTVTLDTRPDSATLARGGESQTAEQVGVQVQTLTRDLAQQLGYEGLSGVVVTEVEAGSPADEAQIQPGDLITEVNREPIRNVRQWNEAVAKGAEKGKVLLRVRGENGARLVLIPLAEE